MKKFTNPSGEQVWRVEGRMPDGHRVRQNFGDRADAIAKKAELELQALSQPVTLSLKRTRLTDEQLTEAEAAFLKLDGKASLSAAVHHYVLTGQKLITRITVNDAYGLFPADAKQRNFRPRTIQELRSRVGFPVTDSGSRWLDELGNADFRRVVHRRPDQAAATTNGNLRVLNWFMGWCVENRYLAVNPVTIKISFIDEKEPEIIALPQVKALLWAAINLKKGVMAPYFAGALFSVIEITKSGLFKPALTDPLRSGGKIELEHSLPMCNLMPVSKLTKSVVLIVLALWSLAMMHCKLEALPGLEFLRTCCFVDAAALPEDCESDGCGAVEDGGYRMEEQTATAPQPLFAIALLPATVEAPLPELQNRSPTASLPPPDLPRVWQFTLRAALPPRAPSAVA